MTDIIAHRGPDGEGHYCNGAVGLGHRRLSIIDLTDASRQPMETRDGRFVLTYNGEIYNFKELKVELSARGHIFQSSGDSEVLLHSFAEWGLEALGRLNGMFAFAIWDNKEQKLTLARDRFGVKPVYYAELGQTFVFASEHKAFRALSAYAPRIDVGALAEYLSFQNFFTDRTLFAGVKLLPAGCYLQVSEGQKPVQVVQYWDFHFEEPEHPVDEDEALDELDRLFRQAVNRQLVSDVEVGCYLSGGMDSGSITALASSQLPFMRTFTVGFDLNSASGVELGYDERTKAEHMSYLFKTEHYEMVLKAGDMERALPKLAWHLEEPRVGQSYPNFYAAKLASKFGKVVLTGTGGDELFAGYPWRYYRAVVNDDFDHYVDKYFGFWQRMVPTGVMPRLLAPVWEETKQQTSPVEIFRGVFKEHASQLRRSEDYVNHSLYFEAKTFLNGLLVVEDKLAMAHGLESRVPFLDNDLVDFAMKLPAKMKLGNLSEVVRLNENEPGGKAERYYERTKDGKLILRKMMTRHIPNEVADREKQGFSAPDASWFKGESIDYVRRRLMGKNAAVFEYLDRETVQALVQDHIDGRENRRLLVWSLLNLEQFCESFL